MIRYMTTEDADNILDIYRQGLETGEASFETEVPVWADWNAKYHVFSRLVWEQNSAILGWAALAPVSIRQCYLGVAEISIYVDINQQSRGLGNKLMAKLIDESEQNGIWTLYSSIFPENTATRRLHIRHGFREVGIRERIAQRNNRWRDTLILERRSSVNGVT